MFALKTATGSTIVPSATKPVVSGMAVAWPCSNRNTNGSVVIKPEIADITAMHLSPLVPESPQKITGQQRISVGDVALETSRATVDVRVSQVVAGSSVTGVISSANSKASRDSASSASTSAAQSSNSSSPKRLHVSNIPFRYREMELKNLLQEFGQIIDVEIIFNERGSKGFGFVTFANSSDAEKARLKMNGTVIEGRRIEVNNATQRIMSKKPNVSHLNGVEVPPVKMIMMSPQVQVAALSTGSLNQAAALRYHIPVSAHRSSAIPPSVSLANANGASFNATALYQNPYLAGYSDRLQSLPVIYPSNANGQFTISAAVQGPASVAFNDSTGRTILSQLMGDRSAVVGPYAGHSVGPIAAIGPVVYRSGYQRFTPY